MPQRLRPRRDDRLDWRGDPGGIDEMLPGNVLADDVAAPRAAPQCEREGHAVDVVAAVGIALRLANHDAADGRTHPQFPDAVIPRGVDAA